MSPNQRQAIPGKAAILPFRLRLWLTYQASFSHVVVAVLAAVATYRISVLDADWVVRAAAWVLVAAAFFFLFGVNWRWYWRSFRARISDVLIVFGIQSALSVLLASAAVVMIWYGIHIGKEHHIVPALLSLLFGGLAAFFAFVFGCGTLIGALYSLFFGFDDKPDGQRVVEGQTIHGDADYASATRVDAALRGKSSRAAPPRQFED